MKRCSLIPLLCFLMLSCAPALNQELLRAGLYQIPPAGTEEDLENFTGKLFILGGIIINTTVTAQGSLIEAIYVPVDTRGYLKHLNAPGRRFLALYPKEDGILEPIIFSKEREITLAGIYIGTRTGAIEGMEYTYPLFEIKELYLWQERRDYYRDPYPYPFWYYPRIYYDPWWFHDLWWMYY